MPVGFEQAEVTETGSSKQIVAFPQELRGNSNLPFIMFSAIDTEFSCSLPLPPGITFSDSASYSTIDLGLIGTAVVDSIGKLNQAAAAGGSGNLAGLTGLVNNLRRTAGEMNGGAAASIAARKIPGLPEGTADQIDFANKQVIAPNTNTNFKNMGIRNFAFVFKLIPFSQEDSENIKSIINGFRKYIYPEGDQTVLKYPPKWKIQFYNAEGAINTYIPAIYETYLKSFSTTYNASTNMFHKDGSPIEIDVNLAFDETKALTRKEIEDMEREKVKI